MGNNDLFIPKLGEDIAPYLNKHILQLHRGINAIIEDDIRSAVDAEKIASALYEIYRIYTLAIINNEQVVADVIREKTLEPVTSRLIAAIKKDQISWPEFRMIEDKYLQQIFETNYGQILIIRRDNKIIEPTNSITLNIILNHNSKIDTRNIDETAEWVADNIPEVNQELFSPVQTLIESMIRGAYTPEKAIDLKKILKSEIVAFSILYEIKQNEHFSVIDFLGKTQIAKPLGGFNLLDFFLANNPHEEIKNEIKHILSDTIKNNPEALAPAVQKYIRELLEVPLPTEIIESNNVDVPLPPQTDIDYLTALDPDFFRGPQL